MISKSKLRKALRKAIFEADPKTKIVNGSKVHKHIDYPMVKFRHKLREVPERFPQITEAAFVFTKEDIQKKLTCCILKTVDRRVKLTYDYTSDNVECFCIGKDCDAITKNVNVEQLCDVLQELLPHKKRVVIVRKK